MNQDRNEAYPSETTQTGLAAKEKWARLSGGFRKTATALSTVVLLSLTGCNAPETEDELTLGVACPDADQEVEITHVGAADVGKSGKMILRCYDDNAEESLHPRAIFGIGDSESKARTYSNRADDYQAVVSVTTRQFGDHAVYSANKWTGQVLLYSNNTDFTDNLLYKDNSLTIVDYTLEHQ